MLSKNQIKEIQSLQLKKNRDIKRLFIAEGIKTVKELIASGTSLISEIYATTYFIEKEAGFLKQHKVSVIEITEDELKKISLQTTPHAVLAVCYYFEETTPKVNLLSSFSLYLDDIRDPGNLGTILRLADWFGITDVFASAETVDVYNPKVIQSTMGAFLRVRLHTSALDDLIQQQKIQQVYGAVLNGKNLYQANLTNGLIVIGNEANGISEKNLSLLTEAITIPAAKHQGSESLNAAMAASIIVSEFFRQSRFSKQ